MYQRESVTQLLPLSQSFFLFLIFNLIFIFCRTFQCVLLVWKKALRIQLKYCNIQVLGCYAPLVPEREVKKKFFWCKNLQCWFSFFFLFDNLQLISIGIHITDFVITIPPISTVILQLYVHCECKSEYDIPVRETHTALIWGKNC